MIPEPIESLHRGPTIQITDLELSPDFRSRWVQQDSSQRLCRSLESMVPIFADSPEQTLQHIAEAALRLCNADSAGISIETKDMDGNPVFHWVAVSGQYERFSGMKLPWSRMPCRVSMDTMRSQHIRVPSELFTSVGMSAEAITDGLSIPWCLDDWRGSIWVAAHGRDVAFNAVDHQIMKILGAMVGMALCDRPPQERLVSYIHTKEQTVPINTSGSWNGTTADRNPEQRFLFELKMPRPRVCLFDAERLEIHGDQLFLLNRAGQMVALIVMETVSDWCVTDRVM